MSFYVRMRGRNGEAEKKPVSLFVKKPLDINERLRKN